MKRCLFAVVGVAAAFLISPAGPIVHGQSRALTLRPATQDAVLDWENSINQMIRSKEIRVSASLDDRMVPGRRIERLEQRHNGVRVWGADVVRQLDGDRA